ncbi:hypothetical protein [Paraburkholderia lycopersici]|uniref:hypothetical protein n=1 Tax=Paraburkholderia lycopersici TaxID=416944 RepID=UPI0015A44BD8|nr:hypothetical protein [Paraburkholderia lycopersici]
MPGDMAQPDIRAAIAAIAAMATHARPADTLRRPPAGLHAAGHETSSCARCVAVD